MADYNGSKGDRCFGLLAIMLTDSLDKIPFKLDLLIIGVVHRLSTLL